MAELFKWRNVLPYSCTIIKCGMCMINYAYLQKWRWANTAHNEATYCTVSDADWEQKKHQSEGEAEDDDDDDRVGFFFNSPNDQRVCWHCTKWTYIFGNVVPPFPDLADVSRSLRGCWWWELLLAERRERQRSSAIAGASRGRTVLTNEKTHRRLRAIIVTVSRVDNQRLS